MVWSSRTLFQNKWEWIQSSEIVWKQYLGDLWAFVLWNVEKNSKMMLIRNDRDFKVENDIREQAVTEAWKSKMLSPSIEAESVWNLESRNVYENVMLNRDQCVILEVEIVPSY